MALRIFVFLHILHFIFLFVQYEETLEPTYSSVDLTEVELAENENGPRENNSILLDVRNITF